MTVIEHPTITLAPEVVDKPSLSNTILCGIRNRSDQEADILGNNPSVTHEHIIACLAYVRGALTSEKAFSSAARYAPSRNREFSLRGGNGSACGRTRRRMVRAAAPGTSDNDVLRWRGAGGGHCVHIRQGLRPAGEARTVSLIWVWAASVLQAQVVFESIL